MIRMIVFVGLCLLSPALRADEEMDRALKAIQGEWKVVKFVHNGREAPEAAIAKLTFTIKGDDIIPSDNPKDPATIKMDLTQKPAWFDLTDRSKETMLGIYELKDDTLTICSADPKGPRPREFTSSKDAKTSLIVLKRAGK